MTDPQGFANAMMRVFERRAPDGSAAFSKHDVREFIPQLVLRAPVPLNTLPLGIINCVTRVLSRAGINADTPAALAADRLDAYYTNHPVNSELARAFEQTLREWNATKNDPQVAAKRLAQFLGEDRREPNPENTVPVEGTVPAAPWARFDLKNDR